MDDGTGADAAAWLRAFEEERGRRLRVLHLGNIANNAYNNAKIQRARGIDADVACCDYYHVMGCPEWEDANFSGDVKDEFCPDWWNVDLAGFERPRWFAQGTLTTCRRYLLAQAHGDEKAAAIWRQLERERWLRCRSTAVATALRFVLLRTASDRAPQTLVGSLQLALAWLVVPVQILKRRVHGLIGAARALSAGATARDALLLAVPTKLLPRRTVESLVAAVELEDGPDAATLARRFKALFPDRADRMSAGDYADYAAQTPAWRRLLEHYDVVQAYSTDGVIPLLAGTQAWAAYEHGTLREIPFEPTPRGRLCAITYREAPCVFVTNSDVMPSVERLGLEPTRVVCLPHAVDTDRLFTFADEERATRPPDEPTLYSPTRHDWVDRDGSWSKGNDVFFRAAAAVAKRHAFRLVLAEWGRDLDASRALLKELEIAHLVQWVSPLRKRNLWTRYLRSHVVVDQFVVPAIGGIAFEAMALGRRVITALDLEQAKQFFGEAPPVLAARTVEELAEALELALADPADTAGRGAAGRAWVAAYHSANRIVDLQARAYQRVLGRGAAATSPRA